MKRVTKYHVELVRDSSKLYEVDTTIDSSVKAPQIIKEVTDFEKWHNEKFGMLCLDNQNNLIGVHIVCEGTINEAPVYTREIVVRALLNNSAAIIAFHNHPGGCLNPSKADIEATKEIQAALKPLHIRLLDHVILTYESYKSFAESGLL